VSRKILAKGWPAQINLLAAFKKTVKNIDFLGHILSKTEQKHLKYCKITEFLTGLGRRNFFLCRWLATSVLAR
jgi:hypothetical protein